MTAADILQAIGTVFVLGLGLGGLRTSLNGTRRFYRYGREMLICVCLWVLSVVVLRSLDLANVLNPTDARTVNGLTAAAFFAIMLQIVWLHRLDMNGRRE